MAGRSGVTDADTRTGTASYQPRGLSFVLFEGAEASETVAAEEDLTDEVPGSVDGLSLDEETASTLGVDVGDVVTLAGRELHVEQVWRPPSSPTAPHCDGSVWTSCFRHPT